MKLKIKQTALALVMGLSVPVVVNAGGIPVIDIAGNAQAMTNFIKEMAEMANQLNTMKSQLAQQQQTYKSLVGARNINDLLSNPALSKYLPSDAVSAYENIRSGNYQGSLGDMAKLAKKYEATSGNSTTQYANLAQQRKENLQKNSLIIDQVFKKSNDRLNQLTRLMNQIDRTSDTKAAADLQNRINSELGLLQIEQNNIALMKMAAEADEKLREQQARDISTMRNRSTNKPTAMPVVFR
ncbi:P-type DNA transfer protein VirB5 [Acinetobacter pittii]|uniref:P-type DNA transfer protein VirB5 n=1 Tax=Acinetobacter pittii TaxID=48296 RepID=UPI003260AAD6